MQHLGSTWNSYLSFNIHLELAVNSIYVNCMQIIMWYNDPLQLSTSKEQSDSKTKVIGYLKLIWSQDVIAMALFLQDLLTILHKVSLKLQEDNSVVTDISVCIKTTASRIRSLEKRYVNIILVSI